MSGFGKGMIVVPLLLRRGGGTCLEAEAIASGLKNVAAVEQAVDDRGRHLVVSEAGGPFAEARIRSNDDAGVFVEFAEQMEEQRAALCAERQVAKFVYYPAGARKAYCLESGIRRSRQT